MTELVQKWKEILEHDDMSPIKNNYRKHVVAKILENTEKAIQEEGQINYRGQPMINEAAPVNAMGGSSSTPGDGSIDIFDPVLISLVRRAMPNLIAYDICGVQPMSGPTGLIFAIRTRYSNQEGDETFYNEVNTAHSSAGAVANDDVLGGEHIGDTPGNTSQTSNLAESNVYNYYQAMETATAEALGTDTSNADITFGQMAFSIEKVSVTAKSRALKAEYTLELAQDLKAIHGLDAEAELSNFLSAEILAEINREIVRTIYVTAKTGAQDDTTTAGVFDLDTDSNGRWLAEKFKGMHYQIERECNKIAKETRRGKGNMVICSADTASALQMAGILDYAPALNAGNNLEVDDTGNTFAGVIGGRIRVFIDPYAVGGNYFVAGYKGDNPFDAGLFYCPYVPLQMVRAVDPDAFFPKVGFKTRYGVVANPFAQGLTQGNGALVKDSNVYYRRCLVTHLM